MSTDQYAPAVRQAGLDLGVSPKGIVIAFATVFVESNWLNYANSSVPESLNLPHDAVGSDDRSVGLFQQQVVGPPWWWGDAATCMDPYKSAQLFYQRLQAQRLGGQDYNTDATSPGGWAQMVQQSAYPDRYSQRMADAQALYDSLGTTPPTSQEPPVADSKRPSYNEFPIWSPNNESRNGAKPRLFLLHTQEGGGGNAAAQDLANFLANPANQVSYHYTVSQASDGGVTVVDCVDTDVASWSVGSANDYSINLCFAGSSASWSREQWLTQSNALDVAAYLVIQDIAKYPTIANAFLGTGGNYTTRDANASGVTDHRFVTDVIGWGTHVDVGPNFPNDVFASRLAFWADGGAPQAPPPVVPAPPAPSSASADDAFVAWYKAATDRELLEYLVAQVGPGDPAWASKGKTLRDQVFGL